MIRLICVWAFAILMLGGSCATIVEEPTSTEDLCKQVEQEAQKFKVWALANTEVEGSFDIETELVACRDNPFVEHGYGIVNMKFVVDTKVYSEADLIFLFVRTSRGEWVFGALESLLTGTDNTNEKLQREKLQTL